MLKPAMKKHFISIILLLMLLAVAASAHARMTLGVVVSSAGEPSLMQREQLDNLVDRLQVKLQEEIVVKEMPDSVTVVNWLDQYAALDMALLSLDDVKEFRGRFLHVGQVDNDGQVNLVARQGGRSELTEKAAEFVAGTGFAPWRRIDAEGGVDGLIADTAPAAAEQPLSIDDVIEAKSKTSEPKVQEVFSPGAIRDPGVLPKDKLVLAVVAESKGVLSSADAAEQVAAFLESVLPVEVQVKEFSQLSRFAEWFMRYRMVDLAVVTEDVAETRLGRDYIAIVEIEPQDTGAGPTELLVGRRGHNPSLQERLKQVLLESQQATKGKELLAILGAQSVKEPLAGQADAVAEVPVSVESPVAGITETPVVDSSFVMEEQAVDYPDPVEPVPPPMPVTKAAAERPVVVMQGIPPEPAVPDVVPVVPTALAAPSAPELPTLPEEVSLPELPGDAESPVRLTLPELPERPVVVKSTATPPEVELPGAPVETVPEPVTPPVAAPDTVTAPSLPVAPDAVAVPEEPQVVTSPAEVTTPVVPATPEAESLPEGREAADDSEQVVGEQKIIEDVLEFAEPVSSQQAEQIRPVVITDEDLQDDDVLALLGEDTVAALVAQPEIPQELRPPGIPVVRPGRIVEKEPAIDEGLFLTSLPEPIEQKKPEPPPQLLPDPEQDQSVLYIVPFVAIMVPKEVNNRIFDQFVDALLSESDNLEMEFVILKDGLKGIDPRWLSVRKYVTGEIYGYLEEAGSDVIDLRAKAKLNYHTPNQDAPVFSYLHPVSKFLNRDTAVIEEERIKLADNIAETLIKEFLGVLKN